jgi:hypothetical protein
VQRNDIINEMSLAQEARELGVSAPEYKINTLQYNIKGKNANPHSNPITKAHLNDLFKNMYLMDKNDISHNDLDIQHVFYTKDGKVEFDCFKAFLIDLLLKK